MGTPHTNYSLHVGLRPSYQDIMLRGIMGGTQVGLVPETQALVRGKTTN